MTQGAPKGRGIPRLLSPPPPPRAPFPSTSIDSWTEAPSKAATPLQRYDREKDQKQKQRRLTEALISYDNARSAVDWLMHDFSLEYEQYTLEEDLMDASEEVGLCSSPLFTPTP